MGLPTREANSRKRIGKRKVGVRCAATAGHIGIGLAITKAIADVHNGTITGKQHQAKKGPTTRKIPRSS
jgi:signal transduction histidine kinase